MRNDVDQVHIGVRVESVSTYQERYSKIDYRLSYSCFWLYHFRILISSKRLIFQLKKGQFSFVAKRKEKKQKLKKKNKEKIEERNGKNENTTLYFV